MNQVLSTMQPVHTYCYEKIIVGSQIINVIFYISLVAFNAFHHQKNLMELSGFLVAMAGLFSFYLWRCRYSYGVLNGQGIVFKRASFLGIPILPRVKFASLHKVVVSITAKGHTEIQFYVQKRWGLVLQCSLRNWVLDETLAWKQPWFDSGGQPPLAVQHSARQLAALLQQVLHPQIEAHSIRWEESMAPAKGVGLAELGRQSGYLVYSSIPLLLMYFILVRLDTQMTVYWPDSYEPVMVMLAVFMAAGVMTWLWKRKNHPIGMVAAGLFFAIPATLCLSQLTLMGSSVFGARQDIEFQMEKSIQNRKEYERWTSQAGDVVDCILTPRPAGTRKTAELRVGFLGVRRMAYQQLCIPGDRLDQMGYHDWKSS